MPLSRAVARGGRTARVGACGTGGCIHGTRGSPMALPCCVCCWCCTCSSGISSRKESTPKSVQHGSLLISLDFSLQLSKSSDFPPTAPSPGAQGWEQNPRVTAF